MGLAGIFVAVLIGLTLVALMVWGTSYEDIWDWLRTANSRQIVQRLVKDLQTSFDYSRQHYC